MQLESREALLVASSFFNPLLKSGNSSTRNCKSSRASFNKGTSSTTSNSHSSSFSPIDRNCNSKSGNSKSIAPLAPVTSVASLAPVTLAPVTSVSALAPVATVEDSKAAGSLLAIATALLALLYFPAPVSLTPVNNVVLSKSRNIGTTSSSSHKRSNYKASRSAPKKRSPKCVAAKAASKTTASASKYGDDDLSLSSHFP